MSEAPAGPGPLGAVVGDGDPVVGVVMGSDSDWRVMEAVSTALREFDVPHAVDVVSAHRMPERMVDYGRAAAAPAPTPPRTAGGATPPPSAP